MRHICRTLFVLCLTGIITLCVILGYANAEEKHTYIVRAIEYTITEEMVPEVSQMGLTCKELSAPVEQWNELGTFEITAYCSCEICCGIWSQYQGLTASGAPIQEGKTISVDPNVIPLGSKVRIVFSDGTEHEYSADDTGSAIKGNIIDLYFSCHNSACNFGRQTCQVYVKQ